MKVSEAMTRDPQIMRPDGTIQEAATMMQKIDAGALPVGEGDRLVGMITDRDIALRGVGQGKGPSAKVREVMTSDVKYCFDDEDLDQVCRNMGDLQVRRLPVINRDKRLVGILSLGDLSRTAADHAGEALANISRPGGQHNQSH